MKTLGLTKPLIGAVHLLPLPGAPRYRAPMRRIVDRALSDADALLSHGVDGLIVENFGDAPFFAGSAPPETIAAMTAVAHELRGLGSFPLGINVLRCDAEAAMAIAAAAGAQFIRANVLAGTMLTDQGPITGRAAQVLRLRESIKAKVVIWADLMVKHAAPLVPTDAVEAALDLRERSLADALIVTGSRTGRPADREMLARLRDALPRIPWIVGSGLTPATLERFWPLADGFIVGTSLKKGARAGAAVDGERVRRLIRARQALMK